MEWKKKISNIWCIIGIVFYASIVPFFLLVPHMDDIIDFISNNVYTAGSFVASIISILLCIYCLVRTIIAYTCNIFLPKIPMPKNNTVKLMLLVLLGVIIGIISSTWCLVLWIITCLLGMATYSFI